MAIPDVPLNVDRSGYAGSIVQPLRTPSGPGRLRVPKIKAPRIGSSPIYSLLRDQAKLRNQMTKAQLKLLREELNQRKRDSRKQPNFLQGPSKFQFPPSNVGQRTNPYIAANSLLSGPRAYREPGDAMKLGSWLNYIGPEAAHRGLMQTGQMLGSRQADPRGELYSAQADALRSQTPGYTPYNYALGNPTMTASPYVQGRGNQFEGGSLPGRVPKTGKAKIHEGEVVVSADQADDDLVQFLTWDKMQKMASGQMDGKGTGPGAKRSYAEGSLPLNLGEPSDWQLVDAEEVMEKMRGKPVEYVNYQYPQGGEEIGEAILEGWGDEADTVKIRPVVEGRPDPKTIDIPAPMLKEKGLRHALRGAGEAGKKFLKGMVGGVDALLDPMFGLIQNQPEGQEALRSIGLGFLAGDDEEQTFQKGSLPHCPNCAGNCPDCKKKNSYQGGSLASLFSGSSPAALRALFTANRPDLTPEALVPMTSGGGLGHLFAGSSAGPGGNPFDASSSLMAAPPTRPTAPARTAGADFFGLRDQTPYDRSMPNVRGRASAPRAPQMPEAVPWEQAPTKQARWQAKEAGLTGTKVPSWMPKGSRYVGGDVFGGGMRFVHPTGGKSQTVKGKASFQPGGAVTRGYEKGSLPEYQRGTMEYPEGALEREDILALMRGLPPQISGEPPASTGQPFGPGSEMEDFGRLMEALPGLSRFFQPQENAPSFPSYGLGGPEPLAGGEDIMPPPQGAPPPMGPPPAGPMGPPVPPEVRGENAYQQSLQEALGRVQGGDLGSPESPLTLEGGGRGPLVRGDEGLPPEMRQFAPEEPSWRQAQHEKTMATLNRQKADRILDYLSREGTGVDPDMRKNLMDQAGYLDKLADTAEKRQDKRIERFSARMETLDQAWAEYRKAAITAQAEDNEQRRQDARDAFNALQERMFELEDKLDKPDPDMTDEQGKQIAKRLAQIQAELTGKDPAEILTQLLEAYGLV